jgi:hypothetical protein
MKIQIKWYVVFLILSVASGTFGQNPNPLMADDSAADDDVATTTTTTTTTASSDDDAVTNGVSSQGAAVGDGPLKNHYAAVRQLLQGTLGLETYTNVNDRQNIYQHYEQRNTGAVLISSPKCSGGLVPKRVVVCGIVQGQNSCQRYMFGPNAKQNLMRVRQLLQKYSS